MRADSIFTLLLKEILLMKKRVEEMEREANKLRELQSAAEKAEQSSQGSEQVPMETEEDKAAADSRSIYVGNVCPRQYRSLELELDPSGQVDYSATPEEIQQHFQACGTINRVTILCDKFTGHPKGYVSVPLRLPFVLLSAVLAVQVCVRRVCRT